MREIRSYSLPLWILTPNLPSEREDYLITVRKWVPFLFDKDLLVFVLDSPDILAASGVCTYPRFSVPMIESEELQ